MGAVSNFLTVATIAAVGYIWVSQGAQPVDSAPPLAAAPAKSGQQDRTVQQSARLSSAARSALSTPQYSFAQTCLDGLNSTVAFSMIGLDKGPACVCMAQRLSRYGLPREDARQFQLAGDMMEMTISRTLGRQDNSDAAIRESLLRRYPDMKRQVTWLRGALFAAFAHCLEQDETAGPRLQSLRAMFDR